MSTTTIQRRFKVGGVLTNADALPTLLTDVTRTDTGGTVLSQETAFEAVPDTVGTYRLPAITDPASGLTYAYTVQFVYQGTPYTFPATSKGGITLATDGVELTETDVAGLLTGQITVVAGCSYLIADGNAFKFSPLTTWPIELTDGWSLGFAAAISPFNAEAGAATLSGTVTLTDGSLYVELAAADTAGLAPGSDPRGYDFDLYAFKTGKRVSLVRGMLNVLKDLADG